MPTLEQILGPTLAAQVRLVPQPEDIRGHILAKTNKWVPVGEDVERWLVEDYKEPAVPTPPAPVARPRRVEVECTETGTETGTCSFSRSYSATGTIHITEERLNEMIRDAGSRDEAIEAFEEWARDNHECGDYDYDDSHYGSEEVEDSSTDERDDNSRSVIEEYLDAHPELLEPEEDEEPEEVVQTASLDAATAISFERREAVIEAFLGVVPPAQGDSETEGEHQHGEDLYEPERSEETND